MSADLTGRQLQRLQAQPLRALPGPSGAACACSRMHPYQGR